jgi:D-aminopeptidase
MPKSDINNASVLLVCLVLTGLACAQTKPRTRDLGVPFDGVPGPLNAITDVKGVEVGHTTLISGGAASPAGVGPVRTGVTAILPRCKDSNDPVFAGWFTENGNGEMTGTTWVEESGFLEGPVMIHEYAQRRHRTGCGDRLASETSWG